MRGVFRHGEEVKNMKEKEININTPLTFSFICPEGRESEVYELFSRANLGKLETCAPKSQRISVDHDTGHVKVIEGTRFDGVTTISSITEIMKALGEKEIAAFSRETKLLFRPIIDS